MAKNKIETFHILHCSTQFSDPDQQTKNDFDFVFGKEPDVITFTELHPGDNNNAIMAAKARANGYRPIMGPGDAQIAVKLGKHVSIKRSGAVPVHGGAKTPRFYNPKFVQWVEIKWYGVTIYVHACHWVSLAERGGITGKHHVLMSQAIGREMKKHSKGDAVAFFGADINADPDDKLFPHSIFRTAGIVTCWEDAGVQPSTHGGADHQHTIDAIGRNRDDRKVVKFKRYRAWPYQNSDHRPFSVWYEIETKRKNNMGGNNNGNQNGNGTGGGTPPPREEDPDFYETGGNVDFSDYTDDELYNLPYAVDDSDTSNG